MNIIFQINGGIGKCIAATAVCQVIKKKYPDSKLIVISGYSDVFLNNPYVDRAYNYGGMSYFYEEFVENKEIIVFAHDPYLVANHIQHKEHLIETWCNLFGLDYAGERPMLYLTDRERKFFNNKYISDKPILLLHPNGGAQTDLKYSWARDIPEKVVNSVIEEFRSEYNVVHIKRDDQIKYQNTFEVSDGFRGLSVLIEMSQKRLLIDSFSQHAAAALLKPSTVCWVVNRPNVFGYNIHNNIAPNEFTKKPELRNSYLNKFNISGDLVEFPYESESDIFNVDDIIKSLKSQ
jgi:hypothetical protein